MATAKITNNPIDLLSEVFRSVEIMGVQSTVKCLQDARFNSMTLNDKRIEYILKEVSVETGVKIERIINGTDKTDERKIAVALCVFFIKRELHHSYSDMKKILKKDEAALSRYFTMVKNVDLENPRGYFDEALSLKIKKLNLVITERKIIQYAKD